MPVQRADKQQDRVLLSGQGCLDCLRLPALCTRHGGQAFIADGRVAFDDSLKPLGSRPQGRGAPQGTAP